MDGRRRLDRLSTLPDELIAHILSFFPTKIAIATSLLSSRLNSIIYSSLTCLDFDDTLVFNPQEEEFDDDDVRNRENGGVHGEGDDGVAAVQENQEDFVGHDDDYDDAALVQILQEDLLNAIGSRENVARDDDGVAQENQDNNVAHEEPEDDGVVQENQGNVDDDDEEPEDYDEEETDDEETEVDPRILRRREMEDKFVAFVNKVLSKNKLTSLRRFSLRFSDSGGRFLSSINKWIEDVVSRNVVEMKICVVVAEETFDCIVIPPSESLEQMDIDVLRGYGLEFPRHPCPYPNLTYFDLRFALYENDTVITSELLFNLPRIDNLHLHVDFKDEDSDSFNFYIKGNYLRTLIIQFRGECDDVLILIDAPNLENFGFNDDYFGAKFLFVKLEAREPDPMYESIDDVDNKFHIGELNQPPGLRDVFIDVGDHDLYFEQYLDEEQHPVASSAMQLMRSVSSTKSLIISAFTTLALIFDDDLDLPVFKNLTKLEMILLPGGGWDLLAQWLEKCPNLEVLILTEEKRVSGTGLVKEIDWEPPKCVPNCLLLHLKQVMMTGLPKLATRGFLKYLLKNAKVLEKLTTGPYNYVLHDGLSTLLLESLEHPVSN